MEYKKDRAYMEVDLEVLRNNYRRIKDHISDKTDIITVVKSDAYGLGAVKVAMTLENDCGCAHFATAYFEEAMELRENGVKSPILVLGVIPDEYIVLAAKNNIEASVSDVRTAESYASAVRAQGLVLSVHIAADVGMSRFGIILENNMDKAVYEAMSIFACSGLNVKGVYSHMTVMSHYYEREFDIHQLTLFTDFTNRLYGLGKRFKRHCACSAMTLLYPQADMDFIRVSALPFGLQNPLYQSFVTDEVIQLKTSIWYIKDVPINTTVGYGPHYTKRHTRLAVIPIGFGDGLHRSISDKGYVLVHERRAKIFGKTCMDFTMIDITDIGDVKCGDKVTVFGHDGMASIPISEYAALYGGTACEVSTSIGKRINRIYVNEHMN